MWYAINHQHFFPPGIDPFEDDSAGRFDAIIGRWNNEEPVRIVVWDVERQKVVAEPATYEDACSIAKQMADKPQTRT